MAPRQCFHHAYESDEDSSNTLATPTDVHFPVMKSVQFADHLDTYYLVPKREEYTETQKMLLWYTKKDFIRFKESCRRIVEWVSNNELFFGSSDNGGDPYFCSRGLERHTRAGARRYASRKEALVTEMYVLRVVKAPAESVAILLLEHTTPCVREALERAKCDEKEAELYQKEVPCGNALADNTSPYEQESTPRKPTTHTPNSQEMKKRSHRLMIQKNAHRFTLAHSHFF